MPIIRCSDQTRKTLREFYSDITDGENPMIMGEYMISILDKLDEFFIETKIYGLTSLYFLNLLSHDTYKSDWYVQFIVSNNNEVRVEYLIPQSKQPWPHAMIKGETKSIEEGVKYILIAMKESGGWEGNQELEAAYKKVTL